jgi:hypothetical protein
MANPEANNPLSTLDQKMRVQEGDSVKNANDLIEKYMDFSVRHSTDTGMIQSQGLRQLYTQKAEELRTEIQRLQGDTTDKMLLEMQDVLMNVGLRKRLGLMFEITAGRGTSAMVSTPEELDRLRTQGVALIQNTDPANLIAEHLAKYDAKHHTKLETIYLEKLGRSVKPDSFDILTKIVGDSGLDKNDTDTWDIVLDHARALKENSATGVEKSVAIAVVSALKAADRLELIRRMAEEPDFPKFLETLVASTYLQVDQALYFLDERIPTMKDDDPKKLEWIALRATIAGPEMQQRQNKVEFVRQESPKHISNVSYGQRNTARELLTFRGIGGTLLAANGAVTILANVMVDLTDPLAIPTNPGFLLGMAQLGVGLEMNRGFAGTMLQPSKTAAKLLGNKDQAVDDENALQREAFARSFGRYPAEAKFYYTMADKIMATYKKKMADTHDTRPPLTIEDLGLKWEDLPKEYQSENKQTFETQISHWAADFYQTFRIQGFDMQKTNMDKMRDDRGIPTYEKLNGRNGDDEVLKLLKNK